MQDIIEAVLQADTTSWSADYYFNNYNTDQRLTSSSQVPRYIYTCLCDLITGFGTTNLTFNQLVVSEYGTRTLPSSPCIVIQPTYRVEPDSDPNYVTDDTLGAEKTYVNILIKNILNNVDYARVRDIGYRIRYILDSKLRGLPNNQYMLVNSPGLLDPSTTPDNSISPDSYFKLQWEESGLIEAKEWAHKFCVSYNIYFN